MKHFILIALLPIAAQAKWVKLESQKPMYKDPSVAESRCNQAAFDRSQEYLYLVCEPIVKTNIRRLEWSEAHREKVFAGTVSSSRFSWSSSSGVTTLLGAIVTPFASLFSSITDQWSESSISYSRTETPVYEDRVKRVDMYRDEIVESYGYNLWGQQEITANTEPPKHLISSDQNGVQYGSVEIASQKCAEYKTIMSRYDFSGDCAITQTEDGYQYHFIGKRNYKLK